MFSASFLFASLLWGSVGLAYCIFGKKQASWVAMIGGALMIAAAYFVGSALWMSVVCIAIMVGVYFLLKQGY